MSGHSTERLHVIMLHLLDVLYQNKQEVIVAHSVKTQVATLE